jgi:hypothetical protein
MYTTNRLLRIVRFAPFWDFTHRRLLGFTGVSGQPRLSPRQKSPTLRTMLGIILNGSTSIWAVKVKM